MNELENGSSSKTEEPVEKDNKNGLQSEKTSESNELTAKKINNVQIENNSKTSSSGNGYLNAINAPNYDNLKGIDFSKNKEQSKLKKNINI